MCSGTSSLKNGVCHERAAFDNTGVFRKAAHSLVCPWALILGGRLYGAKISVEYYLCLFPYTVRLTFIQSLTPI